ncbi:MAG TPA: LysR family transcriptional regulator substrate-binding protein [Nocardioidaceae bacterium]|nr:LysR family transcriptional regulator substrate-binding protein [Nocardioidaceae bacterium]
MASPFRIAFVPGVTPGKWVRTWEERRLGPLEAFMVDESDQRGVLEDERADMCFVRLPVDRDGLHLIPLYAEKPVVVVPKEHPATVFETVTAADIADELQLTLSEDLNAKQAIETVAAGTGVVVVPMSIARLHHRRDVEFVVVEDLPETQVGLAWRSDREDDRFDTFIGVVRGRTARSSRG